MHVYLILYLRSYRCVWSVFDGIIPKRVSLAFFLLFFRIFSSAKKNSVLVIHSTLKNEGEDGLKIESPPRDFGHRLFSLNHRHVRDSRSEHSGFNDDEDDEDDVSFAQERAEGRLRTASSKRRRRQYNKIPDDDARNTDDYWRRRRRGLSRGER